MRAKFLSWFLFILCTQRIISWGVEGLSTSKFEDFNLSETRIGAQLHCTNLTVGLYSEDDRPGSRHDFFPSMKGQKGKGTYGGGNVAHHPRSDEGAASLSASRCFFISEVMLHVSLALIEFLLPYFLTGF